MSLRKVSIPFKRESVSKEPYVQPSPGDKGVRFNSLQTGKCIQR